jgi:hypothetical protein
MIDPDCTLKVGDLLEALKDGRVTPDTKLGYAILGQDGGIDGIVKIHFQRYEDGTTLLIFAQDRHGSSVVYDEVPVEAEDLT